MQHNNIFDSTREFAQTRGDQNAIVFLPDGPGSAVRTELSYAELDLRSRRLASWLQEHRAAGDRVLLLYPPGADFVNAFFACLYAQMIPVPAPLPAGDGKGKVDRLRTIVNAAGCSVLFTDSANLADLTEQLTELVDTDILCAATDIDLGDEGSWTEPVIKPETLALLQFTSGSTSEPRGVMVSHQSLWHNLGLIKKTFGLPTGGKVGSWLPHYHDMGLIGGSLSSIFLGGTLYLMSPMSFLRDPYRWLDLIDQEGIDISPAPNFAYDLCVRRIKPAQVEQLDLSRWRHALNGAEPVDPATLKRFELHFAAAGLKPETIRPCYGMAEVGLLVTGTDENRRPKPVRVDAADIERRLFTPTDDVAAGRELISSGPVPTGFDLRIVDPDSRTPLEDGRIGEIWLRGPSVALGYWGKPDESAAVFDAYTVEDEGPYLRTGDLGVCHDGDLYITGRIKELIIINGRNIYPQDLERKLGLLHPALADGASAAFGVPGDGAERIVVIQEIRTAGAAAPTGLQELADLIKADLSAYAGSPVANVCFVKRGGVLRTTSGKVRRTSMRELFVTDTLLPHFEDLEPSIKKLHRAPLTETLVGVGV
ncbi:fatty acyl-AMP ligase [Kribbella sp. NPDC006257]|uniref:fatty acyl-AMP ligase n=1 Tax=Kribbella sp. NPDC006257 TaxID=3156738 RepID=UPI0033B91FBF